MIQKYYTRVGLEMLGLLETQEIQDTAFYWLLTHPDELSPEDRRRVGEEFRRIELPMALHILPPYIWEP